MTIDLGTSNKRKNSTAVPTYSLSTSGRLKSPTSIYRPTVLLKSSGSLAGYNVMRMMGRCYWITDIVSVSSELWEVSGEIDPLATCRGDILATQCFIKYATVVYRGDLPDTRLAVVNEPTPSNNVYTFFGDTNPHYIFTAIGQGGNARSYALTANQLAALCNTIDQYQLTAIPDITASQSVPDALKKLTDSVILAARKLVGFGSVSDAIISCYWEPWEPITADYSEHIMLGQYDTGIVASPISDQPRVSTISVSFDLEPDSKLAWLNYGPYRTYYLYIPCIGVLNIPSDRIVAAGGTLSIQMSYAAKTGELAVCVQANNDKIAVRSASVRGEIPIGKVSISPLNAAVNAVRVAAGDISALPALAQSLLDAPIESSGQVATMAATGLPWSVQAITLTKTVPGATEATRLERGRPCDQTLLLSALSGGYVQTEDADIYSSQPAEVVREAEELLNGGVYLE